MDKNLTDLMKQAQAMQSKLQDAQKRIESLTIQGVAGAGMVKVDMTGRHEVRKVSIDDSVFKQNGKDLLEDLIAAAFNDAVKKIEKASREQMTTLASGFNLPGGEGTDQE